jgi:hypothetical protein
MEVEGKDPMRGTTLALAATSVAKNSTSHARLADLPAERSTSAPEHDAIKPNAPGLTMDVSQKAATETGSKNFVLEWTVSFFLSFFSWPLHLP